MALTVKEKDHWKTSIDRKIQRTIDHLLQQGTPSLRSQIDQESKHRAIESLGIRELYERFEAVKSQLGDLENEKRELDSKLSHKLKADWPEFKDTHWYNLPEQAVQRRQATCRKDVLAQTPEGRRILHLEQEREELLDTVWLATSPSQVKDLWSRVAQMLQQPLTELQQEALAIPADPSSTTE